jgi:hypothetical protein
MIRSNLVGGPVAVLLVLLAGAFAVAIPASQPAMASSLGECVTAHVDAPFRLPDGLLYPAGTLTLCDGGSFSPVNGLHKILVGGSSVGIFVSNKRNAEIRSMDAPEVLFHRDVDGILSLVGYTMTAGGRGVAYRLRTQFDVWQARSQPELGAIAATPVAAIVSTAGGR